VTLLVGGMLALAAWRNRGDGDPVLVVTSMLLVAAAVAFLLSVVHSCRRHIGASAVLLSIGVAVWPFCSWAFTTTEGRFALAILVTWLAAMVIRRHRGRGVPRLALLLALPPLLHLSREFRLPVGFEEAVGMTVGDSRAILLLVGLVFY